MPVRSTGCLICRKRKIRCDEGRPGCERCATHGVPCPGYRADQPAEIEFKDQTTLTARRAEQKYKVKNGRPREPSETSASNSGSTSDVSNGGFTGNSVTMSGEDAFIEQRALMLSANRRATSPIELHSPISERAQIYQEFIVSYFPKKRYGMQGAYFNFFQAIALKRSTQPSLEQGLDALSLMQLGSLHKDQRILKEASRRYGKALRSVAASIGRGEFMHDDDVMAAVSCLSICELFEECATVSEGWAKHVQGTNVLFAARGPESFTSELALLLFANSQHSALIWALISRTSPFHAAPAWRKLAYNLPHADKDPETRFYDISLLVPGMLQRHDELDMASPTALQEIDDILAECKRLEADLEDWWSGWQDGATLENMVDCQLRPIGDFPTFISLVSDRSFDYAYIFPDMQTGYLYSIYWMVMFNLRTTIQSLQKKRYEIDVNWYPEAEDVVNEDELLGYILNLCQCIPFFTEPVSCSAGHIAIFLPMRTAAFYFTDRGHWRWLKWVGAVRTSVFTKGLVPPNVAGRSARSSSPASLLVR